MPVEGTYLGKVLGNQSAIKQVHDMACWAACLSFWGRWMGHGRPKKKQSELIAIYADQMKASGPLMGGMPLEGMRNIVLNNKPDLGIYWKATFWPDYHASNLTYSGIRAFAGWNGALVIGYKKDVAHVNVIGVYDLNGTECLWVIEPWDGSFRLRNISFYQASTRTYLVSPPF